ncbi:unnamed protein product, partial [marine sediment metagenome]
SDLNLIVEEQLKISLVYSGEEVVSLEMPLEEKIIKDQTTEKPKEEKLNPLIQDPLVRVIECNGSEENIVVKGSMGTKPTAIILSKEETDHIIKKFSPNPFSFSK